MLTALDIIQYRQADWDGVATAAPWSFVPGLLESGISQLLGLGVFPANETESCIVSINVSEDQIADHFLLVCEGGI
jgi:hypothetical protein